MNRMPRNLMHSLILPPLLLHPLLPPHLKPPDMVPPAPDRFLEQPARILQHGIQHAERVRRAQWSSRELPMEKRGDAVPHARRGTRNESQHTSSGICARAVAGPAAQHVDADPVVGDGGAGRAGRVRGVRLLDQEFGDGYRDESPG